MMQSGHYDHWAFILTLATVLAITSEQVKGQDCNPSDITLESQSAIDGFQAQHGPCDRVTGTLQIQGDDISNLTGLSSLTAVSGNLAIYSTNLVNLNGLTQLNTVGGILDLLENESLANLQGLASLTSVYSLIILSNPALESVQDLSMLTNVNGTLAISGNLSLSSLTGLSGISRVDNLTIGQNAFTNLEGLSGLTSVDSELYIQSGPTLVSLDGISSLEIVGGSLSLAFNENLSNLSGLSSLTSVGDSFFLIDAGALNSLEGLSNLASVEGTLIIDQNSSLVGVGGMDSLERVGGLSIQNNGQLKNLDGLPAMEVAGRLAIDYNNELTNIDGLASITSIGGDISVSNNPALDNLLGLASFTNITGELAIQGNANLESLEGLAGLVSVGWRLMIADNERLTNLDHLSALTKVGELVIVRNNALLDVKGLSRLGSAQSLDIRDNPALPDLDGLNALQSLARELTLSDNHALDNVDGLSAITDVGGSLRIDNNDTLRNLDGLSRLTSVGGELYLRRNDSLKYCEGLTRLVDEIDDAEPGPGPGEGGVPDVGGEVLIEHNLRGCNSIEEILSIANTLCFEQGALAYDNWTATDAGGEGILPAGARDFDYVRCTACHGWDRMGTDGGYVRRSRTKGRPNAGAGDTDQTSRNISLAARDGAAITADMIWHQGTGRSYEDGKGSWVELADPGSADNTAAHVEGYTLGNQHPDYSAGGLTQNQVDCLVEFIDSPEADPGIYFDAVYAHLDPVNYDIVDTADAFAGWDYYGGHCYGCHGDPVTGHRPEGGILAYLAQDEKFSEFAHRVRWGIPDTDMTRIAMGSPTAADIANMMLYLQELGGTGFYLTEGMIGAWYNRDRDGEGFNVEVEPDGNGGFEILAFFYTYDAMGNQVYLVAQGTVDGNTAEVTVYITDGAMWGDDFDKDDVNLDVWGTGMFTAHGCDAMSFMLMPNAGMQTEGFTDLSYNLVRLTEPAACP